MRMPILLSVTAFASLLVFIIAFGIRTQRAPLACPHYDFDYLTLIKMLRADIESTKSKIYKLRTKKAPSAISAAKRAQSEVIRRSKLEYFEKRLPFLQSTIPLIEQQVRLGGSSYGCTEKGAKLFLGEMAFPTFNGLFAREKLERCNKELGVARETRPMEILGVTLGPLVALIIGLLTIWQHAKQTKTPKDDDKGSVVLK